MIPGGTFSEMAGEEVRGGGEGQKEALPIVAEIVNVGNIGINSQNPPWEMAEKNPRLQPRLTR